jgi:hypothetical protein
MGVAAADLETDASLLESSGLALHPHQLRSIVDHEVVSRVLAEGEQHLEACGTESHHYRQGCSIADQFRVLHVV